MFHRSIDLKCEHDILIMPIQPFFFQKAFGKNTKITYEIIMHKKSRLSEHSV
uniref:Uncharacterized protein n=1 Tax=Manihot esculenta TaxID=3983 RepID=A0A2C9VW95_MANES